MLAYADKTAIERTLSTGLAHFYSRSRQELWKKGESSGNTLRVRDVWVDCDGDTLIYMVDPAGPSCHTGAQTCFFRRLDADGRLVEAGSEYRCAHPPTPRAHARGAQGLRQRGRATPNRLLDAGPTKVDAKLREEAAELGQALIDEPDDRVASEAGGDVPSLPPSSRAVVRPSPTLSPGSATSSGELSGALRRQSGHDEGKPHALTGTVVERLPRERLRGTLYLAGSERSWKADHERKDPHSS